MRSLLVPSLPTLVFVACFLFVLSTGPTWMFGDGDMGWHIQTGYEIERTGKIPTCDVFSWTAPGAPWVDIEWLSNYLYAKTLDHAGFLGILVIEAAIIAAAWAIVSQTALALGGEIFITLGLVFWAFWLSSIHWFVRPHLRTWFFIALWCCALFAYLRRRSRLVWLVPATTPLWINLHGGWPSGCITLALFAFGDFFSEPERRTAANARWWIGFGALTAALTFANPYLDGIHHDVVQMVSAKPILDITEEWKSPDFRGNAKPFRWFFLTTLAAVAFVPPRYKAIAFALLVTGTQFSLESIRHVPLFLLWLTPVVAIGLAGAIRWFSAYAPAAGKWLDAEEPLRRKWTGFGGALWPALLFAAAMNGVFPPVLKTAPAGFPPEKFPAAAVKVLEKARPEGRLLNDYTWGGYLTWALPGVPIFIDGRNVMYGARLSIDWLTFQTLGPGWRELLERYDIGWTLFPTRVPLTRTLKELGWKVYYEDPVATVLVRPR